MYTVLRVEYPTNCTGPYRLPSSSYSYKTNNVLNNRPGPEADGFHVATDFITVQKNRFLFAHATSNQLWNWWSEVAEELDTLGFVVSQYTVCHVEFGLSQVMFRSCHVVNRRILAGILDFLTTPGEKR
jgi:hypothetical protein